MDLRTVYGLTETSSPAALMPEGWLAGHEESSGITVPVDELRVDAEEGEVGEFLVRAATVVSGYFHQPQATASAFAEGWPHTGDLGRLDHDGFLFIVDRVKGMINRGGERISSLEVERVLYEYPDVAECAVVARPDSLDGELPVAYVVAHGGVTAAALGAFAAERLARFDVPVSFRFLSELPYNEAGRC